MTCDVCGLPDPYKGQGDGIGSCDCPRCDCGAARSSALCICPPDDDGMCSCESYDCQGECCGPGQCSCTPAADDMEAHAAAYNLRYEERRRLYYERYWARVDRRTWRRDTARKLTSPLIADGSAYRRRCLARRRRR